MFCNILIISKVQFQNSLGKLTTSSVYNPRQIIEIQEQESNDQVCLYWKYFVDSTISYLKLICVC